MTTPDPGDLTRRLQELREDYVRGGLEETAVADDPVVQLQRWLDEALVAGELGMVEPNAMVLATVDAEGRPHARTVLLKGIDAPGADAGLVLYTNYASAKGRELAATGGRCTLHLGWYALQRQVRVEGIADPVPREETEAYFASRPRASQLGAWASAQSEVVPDRAALEGSYAEVAARFGGVESGDPIPAPPHWGGYRVRPETVELWQGRGGRMHDRLRYRRDGGAWVLERLAP
ncbi:MAG: pyridoxamine 5'-phosphate oxidase [Nocardioides sp.]|nr:pyridoxamine 5'-phosphate oxidase [Nocardioides sp.]